MPLTLQYVATDWILRSSLKRRAESCLRTHEIPQPCKNLVNYLPFPWGGTVEICYVLLARSMLRRSGRTLRRHRRRPGESPRQRSGVVLPMSTASGRCCEAVRVREAQCGQGQQKRSHGSMEATATCYGRNGSNSTRIYHALPV